MIINRSSKYNELKEFWHDGRKIQIQRVWGGIGWHGKPHFVVVLGEEQFFDQTHYYILCEGQTEQHESLMDTVDLCRRLEAEYRVERWVGKKDSNIEQILVICSKLQYNSGMKNFIVMDAPRRGEMIDESVSSISRLVKPTDKRLHFYSESMIPAELKSMPLTDMRITEFPRVTALANVLYGMLTYGHDILTSSDLTPEPEGVF